MGHHYKDKQVGDNIIMEVIPTGRQFYHGGGLWSNKETLQKRTKTKLGFLAAGTGITPLFKVMDAVYRSGDKSVSIKMLYSNKTEGDILLREECDKIHFDESATNI